MSLLTLAGRGGVAGACAGALSGVVSLVLAEPVLDHAIALEEQHSHSAAPEVFSRDVQHFGLLVAAVLTGAALGLLFGVVYHFLHRQGRDPWQSSLRLAGAGFLAVSLLPFLRYPANPPGVGDPATIDDRTMRWLAAIIISIATVAGAGLVAASLARRGAAPPARQLAAVAVVLAGLGVLFLLPGSSEAAEAPADLLWTFRLLSLLSLAVIWAALGVGFGLAGLRTQRAAVPISA